MDESALAQCQKIIGYEFSNPELLHQAMVHASAAPTRVASNERLEFLGDAVLGMAVSEEIYHREPELLEGEMTKIKSSVVSRNTCAKVAEEMGITHLLVLGKGFGSHASLPPSLGAAAFETVIGAIFLDGGYEPAKEFIVGSLEGALEDAMRSEHQRNYKSLLQQYAQRAWNTTPQYDLLDEKGPEHAKCFEVGIRINNRQFVGAWGNSKKQAEQRAAWMALQELGVIGDEPAPPVG